MDLYYVKHDLDKSEFTVLRAEVIDDTSYDTLIKVRISNDIEGEWVSKDLLYEDRIDAVNAFKLKIETLYGKLVSYRNTYNVGGRSSVKNISSTNPKSLDIGNLSMGIGLTPDNLMNNYLSSMEVDEDGED